VIADAGQLPQAAAALLIHDGLERFIESEDRFGGATVGPHTIQTGVLVAEITGAVHQLLCDRAIVHGKTPGCLV
jgi:hypothetical protein